MKVNYCPFCGASRVKTVSRVPHCTACRTVFMVHYMRQLRAAPKKGGAKNGLSK